MIGRYKKVNLEIMFMGSFSKTIQLYINGDLHLSITSFF